MRALTPRSRMHGEQGASMALILALIIILGLCVGGIAIQGSSGMLAVQGVKNQRADVYGAEGAIDAAINHIRNDLTRGRLDATTCPNDAHYLSNPIFKAASEAGDVTVTCKSLNGYGTEIEGINYPENSILTTAASRDIPSMMSTPTCSARGTPASALAGTARAS